MTPVRRHRKSDHPARLPGVRSRNHLVVRAVRAKRNDGGELFPSTVSVPFYLEEIVLVSLLGGILTVDERAGWQSLLSQPIFASVLVGFLLGDVGTALTVGLVLELVWLSIIPMRGTRRPDAVTGALVGAGTACLLIEHTGDPRFVFVASVGAVLGLVAGEASGACGRWAQRFRERRLSDFELPSKGGDSQLATKLAVYQLFSVGFYFFVQFVLIAVLLPASALVAERITGLVDDPGMSGARRWIELLPAIGAAALVQLYWHKPLNRYLALCAGIFLLLLWFK